ncbi:unnamed protein product [Miscanthus lutarioriparius]|uniref:VWFA domain-containing protein n=1 Tax=Miscanthus lutarioriparius TaxID=422564 RepID=A0A811QMB2_9POAL|nr:unnamed protein product [Miscanthus lutarioriparius]
MVRVKAPPSEHGSNATPIHLVVVLDVWGTTGQQLAAGPIRLLDLLKTMEFMRGVVCREDAAKGLIDVVDAFNVQTETTIDNWIAEARKRVHAVQGNQENVVDKTRTELRPVERAVQILDSTSEQSPGGVKRVGFILLLSDGRQNKLLFDESDVKNLRRKYPVHAFGLGMNHDPGMLHRIAETSRGTYSSIAPAHAENQNNLNNSSKLMEAVALCLGGLKSVVAINTRVKIRVKLDDPNPNENNVNNKSINMKIQQGAHDFITKTKEGFAVGVLYAGEVKDLIVQINFRTNPISSRTRSATLTATLEYEDSSASSHNQAEAAAAAAASTTTLTAECNLPLLVTGTSNEAARTAYGKLKQSLPNSMVLQRMIMLEVLEMLASFAEEYSMTKKKEEVGGLLRRKWEEERKKTRNYLEVAQEMSDLIDDLRRIDDDMEAMAKCLQKEGVSSGLSCIYSWVSSYQMQRATTGLPLPPPAPATPPFLTPDMGKMVEKARNYKQQPPVQEDGAGASSSSSSRGNKSPPPPAPPSTTRDNDIKPKHPAVTQLHQHIFTELDHYAGVEQQFKDSHFEFMKGAMLKEFEKMIDKYKPETTTSGSGKEAGARPK